MRVARSVSLWLLPLLILTAGICTGCGEPPPVDTSLLTGEPPPVDMSLLTGEPCEPPCWQGLTPGVSTEEELYEFLRTSELVDQTTLFRGDITLGSGEVVGVSLQWWSSASMAGRRSQFPNDFGVMGGMLHDVSIFLDCEVTLADLLERYGEPHKWSYAWVAPDIPDLDVALYYPNHGFTAHLTLPADDWWLRPGSRADLVRYYVVVPPEDFLDLGPEAGYFHAYRADSLRDWHGYGEIELE